MWAYNKCIPFCELRREYPGHPDEALEIAKMRFVEECGVVLAGAVNVSVKKDPQRHAYILMAELITEPEEAYMAQMGNYSYGRPVKARKKLLPRPKKKLPVVVGSFRRDLKREINEWLQI